MRAISCEASTLMRGTSFSWCMKNLTRGCAASCLGPTISPSKNDALLDMGCKWNCRELSIHTKIKKGLKQKTALINNDFNGNYLSCRTGKQQLPEHCVSSRGKYVIGSVVDAKANRTQIDILHARGG
jgi:hypothetical protein